MSTLNAILCAFIVHDFIKSTQTVKRAPLVSVWSYMSGRGKDRRMGTYPHALALVISMN